MIRHWNRHRSVLSPMSSMWVSSDISVTFLLIPFTILTTSKISRQIEIRSWFQLRNLLGDNRQSHPELDRSSCFDESILSHEMIDHFEASYTLDMILFQKSLRDLHWSRVWSIESVLESLRASACVHATGFPVLLHWSEKFSAGTSILSFNLRLRSILKFHSVGTALMKNFDLHFTKRWTFILSDVCMTLRSFCEMYSSNWFQDFCALP